MATTPPTVPIFDPQGTLRDVPYEQMQTAVKAGGTIAVKFKAPTGEERFVPANRTKEALASGGTIIPLSQQPVQHPGFWSALGSDLSDTFHGAVKAITPVFDGSNAGHAALGRVGAAAVASDEDAAQSAALEAKDKAQGESVYQRKFARPVARAIGVNVEGMDQSAREGDPWGVLGHAAAVPVMMAATEGLARGVPAAIEAAPSVSRITAPVRGAIQATNKVLEKAPGTVGAAVGGTVGAATKLPYGFEGGAALGTVIGKEVLPKVRLPGEGFGLPNRVTGGPVDAPPFVQKILDKVSPGEVLPPNRQLQAPKAQLGPSTIEGATSPPPYIDPNTRAVRKGLLLTEKAGGKIELPASSGIPAAGELTPIIKPDAAPAPQLRSPSGPYQGPRIVHGESALTQILTAQDNANLIKIAKSRGIDIAKEIQLKPGAGDRLLIDKIINDFSPDELSEVSNQYLENSRFQHDFGEIGPEAAQTLALKSYFPDLKISGAALKRTQAAISAAAQAKAALAPHGDILEALDGNGQLVGSRARGTAKPSSDIDIAVPDRSTVNNAQDKLSQLGYERYGSSVITPKEAAQMTKSGKPVPEGWSRIHHFKNPETGQKLELWHEANSEPAGGGDLTGILQKSVDATK